MIDTAYIRKIELSIGPFKDDVTSSFSNDKRAISLVSDGSRNGLRISFDVQKTLSGAPNQATIEVYNFAPSTRATLLRELTRINLRVGWENRSGLALASGGLLSAVSTKEGSDIKTTLTFLDGYGGMVKGVSDSSFEGKQDIEEVVKSVAKGMPGVTVSPSKIKVNGKTGSRGRIVTGRSVSELNRLAEEYGFSWSVQNGAFQALDDKQSFTKEFEISNQKKNLFKAIPILTGPDQIKIGVEISAFLDPNITPGDKVKLISTVNPELSGGYKVDKVNFVGDAFDNAYSMTIQSYRA